MKAYISVSYRKRNELNDEVSSMIKTLESFNIEAFVFVDQYKFSSNEETAMMQKAMTAIDNCDLLIAETSEKGIGIGVEVGYAKGKGKPVIYLRNKHAEHSTTVAGISDFHIIYNDKDDMELQLKELLAFLVK